MFEYFVLYFSLTLLDLSSWIGEQQDIEILFKFFARNTKIYGIPEKLQNHVGKHSSPYNLSDTITDLFKGISFAQAEFVDWKFCAKAWA